MLEEDFQLLEDEELNNTATEFLCKYISDGDVIIKDDLELDIFMKAYEYKEKKDGDFTYLKQVQTSNVIWEKITKLELIEERDYKHKFVYDFSVKGNETFALFSGIVVHNTLNTFHKAGQTEKSVTVGVPRFQELLNATKIPRMVNCKIFFNEGNTTLQDLRKTVNHNLVCLKLKDLLIDVEVVMNKKHEKWYESFKILYNDNFLKYSHCLTIKLNLKTMFKYRLTLQDISKVIEKNYDDLLCVFSPLIDAQIDIFIDVCNINFTEERLLFIDPNNVEEIYIEECVQPILEKLIICGIPGIEYIYFTHENEEWYVETDGTNFKKLLGHSIIDMKRLESNNVWDIYETLGIEAARAFLIGEFMGIMEGINECHVKLLVEKMTHSGTISSISRYTLKKDESGPMSKSSFEESVDNFLRSAFAADVEKIKGVSAAIICGKRAGMGTGMMDLKINIKKLPDALKIFKDDENDGVVKEYRAIPKIKPFSGKL